MFLLIVIPRVRRNRWVGVRTPWTLASDRVWTETHRLAAYLFVATGVLGLLSILIGLPFYFPLILMGTAYWAPLIDFIRTNLPAAGTVAPGDPDLITVTDSPDEMEALVRKALHAHRLEIATRPRRIRLLGES